MKPYFLGTGEFKIRKNIRTKKKEKKENLCKHVRLRIFDFRSFDGEFPRLFLLSNPGLPKTCNLDFPRVSPFSPLLCEIQTNVFNLKAATSLLQRGILLSFGFWILDPTEEGEERTKSFAFAKSFEDFPQSANKCRKSKIFSTKAKLSQAQTTAEECFTFEKFRLWNSLQN